MLGTHNSIPPVYNGRRASFRGAGPPGSIIKFDTENPEDIELYSFQPHEFPGEVAFVPKIGKDVTKPEEEDCGYLVCFVTDGRDMITDLVILDAEGKKGSLTKGPISRTRLPTFIPHGLHGGFMEGLTFDFEEAVQQN